MCGRKTLGRIVSRYSLKRCAIVVATAGSLYRPSRATKKWSCSSSRRDSAGMLRSPMPRLARAQRGTADSRERPLNGHLERGTRGRRVRALPSRALLVRRERWLIPAAGILALPARRRSEQTWRDWPSRRSVRAFRTRSSRRRNAHQSRGSKQSWCRLPCEGHRHPPRRTHSPL
jgi:hypothetical protein